MPHRSTDSRLLLNRRALLRWLAGGAVLLAWPGRAHARPVIVKLERVPELKKVGGWTVLWLKGQEIMLIRDAKTSVRGLNPTCTHKKTRLRYDPRKKVLVCPKHGCRFDLKGKPLRGPAKKPLYPVYSTWLDLARGRILIHL
jgi:nitrite reductase/ring-hydroxylating ferredoxin subunit